MEKRNRVSWLERFKSLLFRVYLPALYCPGMTGRTGTGHGGRFDCAFGVEELLIFFAPVVIKKALPTYMQ